MTTTTNPATALPDWLDLDGYCPPDVRLELEKAAELLEAAREQLEQAAQAAAAALARYEEATVGDFGDDLADTLHSLTGFTRVRAAARTLENLTLLAQGEEAQRAGEVPAWAR